MTGSVGYEKIKLVEACTLDRENWKPTQPYKFINNFLNIFTSGVYVCVCVCVCVCVPNPISILFSVPLQLYSHSRNQTHNVSNSELPGELQYWQECVCLRLYCMCVLNG